MERFDKFCLKFVKFVAPPASILVILFWLYASGVIC